MFLTRGGGRRAEDAPAGPHGLAREVVAASQRGRLIEAIAHVVADKGYPQTTVADVIERAGVSRKTFYEHFRDKETCFLAAYDTGVAVLLDTVRAAEGIRGRVRAYLGLLAAEPAFARTFLIEVQAAGPEALQRRREVHDAFAAFLGGDLALAAVGATQELVTRWVEDGRTADLLALEDALVRVNEALQSNSSS